MSALPPKADIAERDRHMLVRQVVTEVEKHPLQSLVIVTDAFHRRTPPRPQGDDLEAARVHARRLRDLGVQIAAGFKGLIRGGCPLDRAGIDRAFYKIVEENVATAFYPSRRNWRNGSARSQPRRRDLRHCLLIQWLDRPLLALC
jgi:hypothetical protein